jgi:hypothetical protein
MHVSDNIHRDSKAKACLMQVSAAKCKKIDPEIIRVGVGPLPDWKVWKLCAGDFKNLIVIII